MDESVQEKESGSAEKIVNTQMDFSTFCEETNKVILLPSNRHEDKYEDIFYSILPTYSSVPVHGLYFPNNKEIELFCEKNINGDEFYRMNARFLPNMDSYFANSFVKKFVKLLNIKFENGPFEDLREFLTSEKKTASSSVNINDVVELIGQAYSKKTFVKNDLLESDIRIKALKINPSINVIANFEKGQIGYYGSAYAIPDLKK